MTKLLESLIQNPKDFFKKIYDSISLARNLTFYLFYQRFNTTVAAREIEELEDNLIQEAILYLILTDLEEEKDVVKPCTKRHGRGAKGTIAAHQL